MGYELGLIKSVMFLGGKYNPSSPQAQEFAKNNVPIACAVCHDEFDHEDLDSVELFEVRFAPTLVGKDQPEGVWVIFYCKSCLNSLFGTYGGKEPPPGYA